MRHLGMNTSTKQSRCIVAKPDRLFDQLLGLSGHGARDCEPERLDRVAPENSIHRIAIASRSKQLQLLSYSSFPGDCLKSRRQLETLNFWCYGISRTCFDSATKSTVLELGRSHAVRLA